MRIYFKIIIILGLGYSCNLRSTDNSLQSEFDKTRIIAEIEGVNSARKYRYESNFFMYLKSIGITTLQKTDFSYIILPANSCSPCLNSSIENLLSSHYSDTELMIIIGNASNIDTLKNPEFNKLTNQYDCKIDSSDLIFEYHIGIGEPTLIYFDKNENSFQIDLTFPNWAKIDSLIKKL